MFLVVRGELEPKMELEKEEKREQAPALQIEFSIASIIPVDMEESRRTLESGAQSTRRKFQVFIA